MNKTVNGLVRDGNPSPGSLRFEQLLLLLSLVTIEQS